MPTITPRTFKGTRDFLPRDMIVRDMIVGAMKSIFTRYGFAPLETPAVEFLDILEGKYGDEADRLLYPLARKGGKELALRYDLTVPLARVMAMNPHLPKPFKRYQIQPVWRADSPQLKRGRYREFYQCDVDTVGSSDLLADAEIIALMADVLNELNIGEFRIRLNSRKILRGIITGSGFDSKRELEVCRSIDKIDKEGMDFVKHELIQKGHSAKSVDMLSDILQNSTPGLRDFANSTFGLNGSDSIKDGLREIETIVQILEEMKIQEDAVLFDVSLARGLDYYTGSIFEAVIPERPEIGSVAGGGRYDDLIGLFAKNDIPAVGTSFGLERIHSIVSDSKVAEDTAPYADILVCFFSQELRSDCLSLTRTLREAGLRTEIYYRPDKLKKQFNYADKKGIPYVLVFGPDEKTEGICTLKEMKTGTQKSIDITEVTGMLKKVFLT